MNVDRESKWLYSFFCSSSWFGFADSADLCMSVWNTYCTCVDHEKRVWAIFQSHAAHWMVSHQSFFGTGESASPPKRGFVTWLHADREYISHKSARLGCSSPFCDDTPSSKLMEENKCTWRVQVGGFLLLACVQPRNLGSKMLRVVPLQIRNAGSDGVVEVLCIPNSSCSCL